MKPFSSKKRLPTSNSSYLPILTTPQNRKKINNISLTSPSTSVLKNKPINFRSRIVTEIGTINKTQSRATKDQAKHNQPHLQSEVDSILDLFKEINRLREQYGVIEERQDGEDESYYLQIREITYNSRLATMNEQIRSIKGQIQLKIEKVIRMAKYHPRIRNLICQMLQQASDETLTENLRVGKVGAMKAQRRLIQASLYQQNKI